MTITGYTLKEEKGLQGHMITLLVIVGSSSVHMTEIMMNIVVLIVPKQIRVDGGTMLAITLISMVVMVVDGMGSGGSVAPTVMI